MLVRYTFYMKFGAYPHDPGVIHVVRKLQNDSCGAPGVWGSGENGYLFSRSRGALVIIFRDLGSKLIDFGILGALQKSKKISP